MLRPLDENKWLRFEEKLMGNSPIITRDPDLVSLWMEDVRRLVWTKSFLNPNRALEHYFSTIFQFLFFGQETARDSHIVSELL